MVRMIIPSFFVLTIPYSTIVGIGERMLFTQGLLRTFAQCVKDDSSSLAFGKRAPPLDGVQIVLKMARTAEPARQPWKPRVF
eukprot:scaffold5683_cov156-Amphora_coffeaeformis.AAC.5